MAPRNQYCFQNSVILSEVVVREANDNVVEGPCARLRQNERRREFSPYGLECSGRTHDDKGGFSAAGAFTNKISNTSSPAPTTIALSATLNAGHWYDPI